MMATSHSTALAERIMASAVETGVVWLGGEMEFPANRGPSTAYTHACRIAEACGYTVAWKYSKSAFEVVGGDIPDSIVCEWYAGDNKEIRKIEVWSCASAYRAEPTIGRPTAHALLKLLKGGAA